MTRRRTDISPSKLRDLEICPLRAHFRHRCGLSDPGDEAREVGGIVAGCLAAVSKPRLEEGDLFDASPVTKDELIAALETRGGSSAAVRGAAEILETLADQLDLAHTVAVNESWQLEVGRDARTGWAIVAGGRWEQVDRLPDGTVRLVDYRTGRVRSRQALLSEGQVGLRLAALRARFPDAPRVEALVWWVDRDVKVWVPWTQREDWFARLRVRIGYQQLKRGDSAPRVSGHCAKCPFRQRCWAYQDELRTLEAAPPAQTERWDDPRWLLEERERLKQVAKLADAARRDLDEAIRAQTGETGELRAGDLRARVVTRRLRGWEPRALPILAQVLERDPIGLLEEVGQVSTTKLRALLREASDEAREAADADATSDAISYVDVREVAPFREPGEEAA